MASPDVQNPKTYNDVLSPLSTKPPRRHGIELLLHRYDVEDDAVYNDIQEKQVSYNPRPGPKPEPVDDTTATPVTAPYAREVITPQENQPPQTFQHPNTHRASSGAWMIQDDNTLLAARASGQNWSQIQAQYFPNKTGNACRKRHERLTERREADSPENRGKAERVCKEYMAMRREIWASLAARTGEKWNVVEKLCMSNGMKNIQLHARAYARKERLGSDLSSMAPAIDIADDSDHALPGTNFCNLSTFANMVGVAVLQDTLKSSEVASPYKSQYRQDTPSVHIGNIFNIHGKIVEGREGANSSQALLQAAETTKEVAKKNQVVERKPAPRLEHVDQDPSDSGAESTSSSQTSSSWESALSPRSVTARKKQIVIDRIVAQVMSWLNTRLAVMTHQCNGTQSTTNDGQLGTSQCNPESQGRVGDRKRRRDSSSKNASDDDAGEDESGRKRKKGSPKPDPTEDLASLRLACPFLKRNRQRYRTRRSCAWAGFSTVHRVKEHLYRRHMAPKFKCHRCCEQFGSDSTLAAHLRSGTLCEIRAVEPEDGIDDEQLSALRSRKKSRKDASEPEKWAQVYKILFPYDDPVPSPYYDADQDVTAHDGNVLRRFGDYARSEFPRLLRPELEGTLDAIIEQNLNSETIISLSQTILRRVLQSFEHMEASSDAARAGSSTQHPGGENHSFSDDRRLEDALREIDINSFNMTLNVDEWIYGFGEFESLDSGYASIPRETGTHEKNPEGS